jgi:hypothetical protein
MIRIIVAIPNLRDRQHAKQAFDDVVANLDLLDEEFYNNSINILQILGNNLSHWNLNSNMDVDVGNNNYTVVFVNMILPTI